MVSSSESWRVAQNEGMKRMYQERGFSSNTFGVALVDTGT